MTDRTRSPGARGKTSRTAVETKTALDPTEEKALRMRHGYVAPDDLDLEQVGQNHPATAAKLREIELRAFEMSGRLAELRAEAGLDAEADPVKAKIIQQLAQKKKR